MVLATLRQRPPVISIAVFDAGSSGTRVSVFAFDCEENQTEEVPSRDCALVYSSESWTSNTPLHTIKTGSADSPLPSLARQIRSSFSSIDVVYLGATGGVRQLNKKEKKALIAESNQRLSETFNEPPSFLSLIFSPPSLPPEVVSEVVDDHIEAKWLQDAAKVLGALGVVVEVGGASTQVAYTPIEIQEHQSLIQFLYRKIRRGLFGRTPKLISLEIGTNSQEVTEVNGDKRSSIGNAVKSSFDQVKGTVINAFTVPLEIPDRYLVSGAYHIAKDLGLPLEGKVTVGSLTDAVDTECEKVVESEATKLCLRGIFIEALLLHVLKLKPEHEVMFTKSVDVPGVGTVNLGWPLGAALHMAKKVFKTRDKTKMGSKNKIKNH